MNTKKKKIRSATDYAAFLEQLKNKVQQAQLKASLAVNSELIQLYWDIGKSIVEKQEQEGWKAQIIENCVRICKILFLAYGVFHGQTFLDCKFNK
jgi:predicted nuclease of restriction endonuclease-like (RecB) superfamily